MLAIRMQRTGRRGHASFRVVVQDSRQTPTSGKVVALLGDYDPHNKTASLAKDKTEFYLKNGAQPSERAAKLLKAEGIKLPKWVQPLETKKRSIRNPDKLRKNRPAEAPAMTVADEAATTEVKEPTVASEPSATVAADESPAKSAAESDKPDMPADAPTTSETAKSVQHDATETADT